MDNEDQFSIVPSQEEILSPVQPFQEFSGWDKAAAYFQTETIGGSMYLQKSKDFAPDPNWKPTSVPVGYEDYAEYLGHSESQDEFNYKIGEIGKTLKKRELASELGFVPALLIQGIAPENWLGFTSVLKKIKGATNLVQRAKQGAVGGALGAALQESGLQYNDVTRTQLESVFGVGAGAVFGGVLGGTAGLLIDKKKFLAGAIDTPDEQMKNFVGPPRDPADQYGQGSMSAAESFTQQRLSLEEQGLQLNAGTETFLKVYGNTTPTLRSITSNSKIVRLAAQKLHSFAGILEKTNLGVATEHAVETKLADFHQRVIGGVTDHFDKAYSDMVFGREPKMLDFLRMRFGEKKVTKNEFYDMVFESFVNDQPVGIKQVDEAADYMSEHFFKPLLEEGKRVGIFGDEVGDTVDGRQYFTFVFDQDLLKDKNMQTEFVSDVTGNLKQRRIEAAESYARFSQEIKPLKDELALHKTALQQAINATKVSSDHIKEVAQLAISDAIDNINFPQLFKATEVNQKSAQNAYKSKLRKALRERFEEVFAKVNKDADFNIDLNYNKIVQEVIDEANNVGDDLAKLAPDDFLGAIERQRKEMAKAKGEDTSLDPDVELSQKTKAITSTAVKEVSDQYNFQMDDALAKQIKASVEEARIAMLKNIQKQMDKIQKSGGEELTPEAMEKKISHYIDVKLRSEMKKQRDKIIKEATEGIRKQIAATAKKIQQRKTKHGIDDLVMNMTDDELSSNANQTLMRILGTPFGSMPYDSNDFKFLRGKGASVGFNKARTQFLTHKQKQKYVIKNPEVIMNIYGRKMKSEIALRESGLVTETDFDFADQMSKDETLAGIITPGDPAGSKLIYDIYQDYNEMIRVARDLKNKHQSVIDDLIKERNTAMKDVKAMIDISRGMYKLPDDPLAWTTRGKNLALDLTYITRLGGMLASSLTDPGKIVMQHGMGAVFSDVLKPLVTNLKGFKMTLKDARESIGVLEHIINSRILNTAEIVTDFHRHSKTERLIGAATDKFGKITFMAQWNSLMKQVATGVAMQRVIRQINTGKADKFLLNLGIDDTKIPIIKAQLDKYGDSTGGLSVANINAWDDKYAADQLRLALRKHIDNTIITPGMDKPLITRHGIGQLATQFQSFNFASMEKTLLPGIQNHDKAFFQGVMTQVMLGMMVYKIKMLLAGKDTSDNPRHWIAEGIDRSGVLGILMTYDSYLHKLTAGNVSLRRLISGEKEDVSRYQQRTLVGTLLGPSAGIVEDFIKVVGGVFNEEDWSKANTHSLRRLIPYNNVVWLNNLFNMFENAGNSAAGVKK